MRRAGAMGSIDLGRLARAMIAVESALLRRALEKRGYRGVEQLDLAAMVEALGVRGARNAARYYSNLLFETGIPALIELPIALLELWACERRYVRRGWLRRAHGLRRAWPFELKPGWR